MDRGGGNRCSKFAVVSCSKIVHHAHSETKESENVSSTLVEASI